MSNKVNICGININNVTMQEALGCIEGLIAQKQPCYVTTPNVDHVVLYHHDAQFARCYDGGALCVADGMPILWAARFLGTPLKEKVSGSDLMPKVCELANQKGYKLFLLGGRPGAADAAITVLLKTLRNLKVVGRYSPPMGFEKDELELEKIVGLIKKAQPDILFVGLGAPKQEKWIKKYHKELGVPVSIGVGVTFEFIAGIVKRAPLWMQKGGLEWFWRLCREPGRLWKRYLIDDMQFFGMVINQKIKRKARC